MIKYSFSLLMAFMFVFVTTNCGLFDDGINDLLEFEGIYEAEYHGLQIELKGNSFYIHKIGTSKFSGILNEGDQLITSLKKKSSNYFTGSSRDENGNWKEIEFEFHSKERISYARWAPFETYWFFNKISSGCLTGQWSKVACNSGEKQLWIFNKDLTGRFENPDCNNICENIKFPFTYTIQGNTCYINYSQPPSVYCTGYGINTPPKPNNDSFTFNCSGNKLSVSSGSGPADFNRDY